MRPRDTADVMASVLAILADGVAMLAGFLAATWIRFNSGLIPLFHDSLPPRLYHMYGRGAAVGTILVLFIFQWLGLYIRPQLGSFPSKVPRLIRAVGLSLLLATAVAFIVRTEPPLSRVTMAVSFLTVLLLVIVERYILFRVEILLARKGGRPNRILILGTDAVAAHLRRGLEREPCLRCDVVGFMATKPQDEPAAEVPREMIRGRVEALEPFLETNAVDQVVLTDSSLGHQRILELILICERRLITFNMVPDIFGVLTTSIDIRMVDDIPLLGVGRWPLDHFWN